MVPLFDRECGHTSFIMRIKLFVVVKCSLSGVSNRKSVTNGECRYGVCFRAVFLSTLQTVYKTVKAMKT